MKIRTGFVSNSSSSSFVCDLCGYTTSGWDGYYEDDDVYTCEYGHAICGECLAIKPRQLAKELNEMVKDNQILAEKVINEGWYVGSEERKQQYIKDLKEELDEASPEEREDYIFELTTQDGLHPLYCPVCRFEAITDTDMKSYLKKETKIDEDTVFQEIKKINKRRKKLYDNEYITHCCVSLGKTTTDITSEIKQRFSSFSEFKKYIKGE